MSKKQSKSPSNNANNSTKWETNIVNSDLLDTNWSYSLAFLAELIPEDNETIGYINSGISTGLRKKFTLITTEKINQLIAEFGNPKTKKGKDAPANFEICEAGKLLLDKKEDIPIALRARFIKWILLTHKTEDLKHMAEANKKVDDKASKPKKGVDKSERTKSSGGKKGAQATGKKSPEPPSVKIDTKLRKRGEPDPDIQYIDDEPDDGSSRYFIVSGMVDCRLLEALGEIGCVATSVIKVTRDIHIPIEEEDISREDTEKVRISTPKDDENIENEYETRLEYLQSFWTDLEKILKTNKHLLNTPIVTLVAKHLMFPIEKEDEEMKNKCAMDLFNCLAVLKYDLLDLKRQWKNYLEKSKLIFIPVKTSSHDDNTPRDSLKEDVTPLNTNLETSLDATFDKVDMNYYYHLIQDVPIESTSIYLQMSAMLEQIEVSCGEKVPNWNLQTPEKPNELHYDTAEIMKTLMENIYLPKNDLAELRNTLNLSSDESDSNKNNEYNFPIHALDSIVSRDHEIDSKILGPNGVLNHELKMLVASFRQFHFQNIIPTEDAVSRKRATRLQELLKYLSTTGLSNTEINYAIKIFILENLTFCGVDENGFIIINNEEGIFQNNMHPIWDDPYLILDEVTESIIREEIKLSRNGNDTDEKEQTFVVSENSSLVKSDNPDGILKTSRLSSRSQSPDPNRCSRRKSSVHFMVNDQDDKETISSKAQLDVMSMLKDQDSETFQTISLEYLQNIRKRNLTEWCFEEFYEPHVLLQIIHDAIYKLPYIDIYQQRRVDGQLLVLHNPFHPDSKLNQQSWNIWLHSNVGFRSYLDFVSDKITDWNRDQEAIYQANLLSKELELTEVAQKIPEAADKTVASNDKSKKSKVTKSRSRSSSRTSSADENVSKELTLIIPGSLKAQKLEKDRIEKAKEEEELKKELKKQSSSPRKAGKDVEKDADKSSESKRPNSRTSNKSKLKKTTFEELEDNTTKEIVMQSDENVVDIGEYWPFISYDLGDNLAHFWGNVFHLFPSDGSTIRIFRMIKLSESKSVRLSVITPQSHVFTVHIIDPTYDNDPEIDDYGKVLEQFQQQSNVCHFGDTTCTFNDGITIAASNKGCMIGQVKDESVETSHPKQEGEITNENPTVGDVKDPTELLSTRSIKVKESSGFCYNPKIFLTSPDGILVRVGNEFSDFNEKEERLLIHMSKCVVNNSQSNASDLNKDIAIETSRYITSEGVVISIFNNNTLKVLYSDGTIAISQLTVESSTHVEEDSEESKQDKPTAKESPSLKKRTKQAKVIPVVQSTPTTSTGNDEPKQRINYFRKWTVYLSNGETFETEADLNYLYVPKIPNNPIDTAREVSMDISNIEQNMTEKTKSSTDFGDRVGRKSQFKGHQMKETLHVSSATDPSSGETLVTRSDGTLLLVSQDAGIFLSEHSDGTRFTKYYTVEKLQHPTTENGEVHKSRITELLLIESREYPSITIDVTNGKVETRFGSMGSLLSDSTSFHVFKHSDNTEIEYRSDGEIIFTSSNSQMSYLQPDGPCSYVFNATSNIICEIVDNEGTEFIVDVNGDYSINTPNKSHEPEVDDEPNEEDVDDVKARNSTNSMSNENADNIRKYDHHAPRLFSIHSDGSGSELLRYRDIVDTLVNAEIDEDYFHYKEEIQDSPQIFAHTIINPDHRIKPWKYNYSRKTILPKGLTCRDLKSFPASENVIKGPKFAMSIGRGLKIDSNPITTESRTRQPKTIKPDFWMNPMQFRQLYHYPNIDTNIRDSLATQFVEYNKKILSQRKQYEDLEIHDDRTDDEKIMANEIMKKYEKQTLKNAMNYFSNLNQESGGVITNQMTNNLELNAKTNHLEDHQKLNMILENERIEKEKELESKYAIKNKIVPNYFTSIYGKEFVSTRASDLASVNDAMKSFTASMENTESNDDKLSLNKEEIENPGDHQEEEKRSESVRDSPMEEDLSANSSEFKKELGGDQSDEKNKPSPKLVVRKKEKKYLYYDSTLFIPSPPNKIPISNDLYLPKYLYAQRPAIEPNIHQAIIEDPVRRKVYTTSMVGGSNMSQVHQRQTRGISVLPARVDTGLLREGKNYIFKIKLINTGPESSYFKVRQPPPSTGIRVEFLPGPIPAGLSRRLQIHIYAIAHNLDANEFETFVFEHPLQVTTSTDKFVIPIVGRVMTAHKYDSIYSPLKEHSQDLSSDPQVLPIAAEHV